MTRAALAVTLVLTLAASGACGTKQNPKVATARPGPVQQTPGPSAPTASATASSDYDKALRYTRCMTANGVPTKDPVEGEELVTVNTIHVGEPAATFETRRTAFGKCKQYLPATWPIKWDPKEIARSQKYVECMKRNGIDQAWPDANGIAQVPTDRSFEASPEYLAAVAKCRHLVDDPANDLPENK
jgi:hypothetical protein